MKKEEISELIRKEEQRKARVKRQNEAAKSKWDTVSCRLPKGTKEKIEEAGETVNGLINRLLADYLGQIEQQTGNTPEQPQAVQPNNINTI